MERELILTQIMSKFQDKNKREFIKDAFKECYNYWEDISGFLGVEDIEGNITIQFKLGDENYFHLHKDKGFTGHVYNSGEPAIFSTEHIKYLKETENQEKGETIAKEMVSLIKFRDENNDEHNIGVLLLDSHFGINFEESDLIKLNKICNNISNIISDKNPWDLRGWWKNHESVCLQNYKRELNSKLVDTFNNNNYLIDAVTIYDVLENSTKNPKVLNLKDGTVEIENIDNDVLNNGTYKIEKEKNIQSMIGVPFPINGAIKGIVTISKNKESEDDSEDLQQIVDKISDLIDSIKYPLLNETFQDEGIGTKVFSFLSYVNNPAYSLKEKLSKLCTSFGKINSSKITVFINESFVKSTLQYKNVKLISKNNLNKKFKNKYKSTRPRYWDEDTNDSLKVLKCKIYYGKELIAGLEAKSTDGLNESSSKIDAQWDGPILEGVSALAGKAISQHLKEFHLKECLKIFRSSDKMEIIKKCSQILEASFICLFDAENNKYTYFYSAINHDEDSLKDSLSKSLKTIDYLDTDSTNLYWEENLDSEYSIFRSLIFNKIHTSSTYLIGGLIKLETYKRNFDKSDELRMNIIAALISEE